MSNLGRDCVVKLSICIPTYNRRSELKRLLWSIPEDLSLEVVVCDDGSTDGTSELIECFSRYSVRYLYQENKGRSAALVTAIMMATGDYIILMDSDDVFISGGLEIIIDAIEDNPNKRSLVFGVTLKDGLSYFENIPKSYDNVNLLSLRADYDVKGDLKEVTERELLKSSVYSGYGGSRRVPTSLIWYAVAEKEDSVVIEKTVVIKEYLSGGMTRNILLLKATYPRPLVDLYRKQLNSNRYKSSLYRYRCLVLMLRYSFHDKVFKVGSFKEAVAYLPAFLIFIRDLIVLMMRDVGG